MGFFDNFLGKKAKPPIPKHNPVAATIPPPKSTQKSNEMIKAFDAYGREIQITREEWRTKVLPGQFQQNWTNPEGLAACITQALQDGFPEEALPPARQLERIDTVPQRGATLLGVTLLQLKNFKEANFVLTIAAAKYSNDGTILTNLAKACAGLGQQDRADMILWKALEADPNLDNGLLWYVVQQKERGGDQGELDALLRVAALPGSWRPQLWLARRELQHDNNLPTAMAYYHQALERLGKVPSDVLMQISGDLGNAGHLMELLELCAPRFDVKAHGLTVGNNLIKAYVDTGQANQARKLLEQLYAQQRPDWKQMLLYWDKEIDKLDKNYGPIEGGGPPEMALRFLKCYPLRTKPRSKWRFFAAASN
jgi:tetratricopeptide (TPR) repeat protein